MGKGALSFRGLTRRKMSKKPKNFSFVKIWVLSKTLSSSFNISTLLDIEIHKTSLDLNKITNKQFSHLIFLLTFPNGFTYATLYLKTPRRLKKFPKYFLSKKKREKGQQDKKKKISSLPTNFFSFLPFPRPYMKKKIYFHTYDLLLHFFQLSIIGPCRIFFFPNLFTFLCSDNKKIIVKKEKNKKKLRGGFLRTGITFYPRWKLNCLERNLTWERENLSLIILRRSKFLD